MRDCFISAVELSRFDLNRFKDHRAAATERWRMRLAKPAKESFLSSCATAYTATGMYLPHKSKCKDASSGPRPSLACGAKASPEHGAANLDGVEKVGLLQCAQRAQIVASRGDCVQHKLCNQAHVAADVDPKRVDDHVRPVMHQHAKHDY
jgi:hypothetical protein